MEFKIGDNVKYLLTGKTYIIKATKDEPYNHEYSGLIYPSEENDFVIIETPLKEGVVTPFTHAEKNLLQLIED